MSKLTRPPRPDRHYLRPILAFIYILLIIYGSLFPWKGWTWPPGDHWLSLFEGKTRYFSTSDILINILLYIPVGVALYWPIRERVSVRTAVWLALGAGMFLSTTMEFLQLFLPGRIASFRDIILNGLGTAFGIALAWMASAATPWGRHLYSWREREFSEGRYTDFGLAVIFIWSLAQLSPFFPALRSGAMEHSLTPLWHGLSHPATLDIRVILAATMQFFGLAHIGLRLFRAPSRINPLAAIPLFLITILVLKIPILHQQLQAEALIAWLLTVAGLIYSQRWPPIVHMRLAIVSLLAGYLLSHLSPPQQIDITETVINWTPFKYQIQGDARGLSTILDGLWPSMGLAFCVLSIPHLNKRWVGYTGGLALFFAVLFVEWWQQWDITQRADVSDILLAMAGWTIAWIHPRIRRGPPAEQRIRLN